jgi:hypothetical protein
MTRIALFPRYAAQAVLMLVLAIAVAPVQAQNPVFGDEQLIEFARTTYQGARGGDESAWMYAALHINALIQRNPPAVRNSPAFAKELAEGLKYAGERLTAWYQAYSQRPTQSAVTQGGTGVTRSGLSTTPPTINWPR